jgi:two-component system sensor histidine kinase DesK
LFAPWNGGALAFFIYAAAHAAWTGPPRFAVRVVLVIIAAAGLESLLLRLPPYFGIVATLFAALIGGINIHFAEVSRKNAKLRLAQEDVERLAQIAERERIARDLHDLLGHTLSVIVLKAELASKLAERDPARALQEIRDVERVSRQALGEVRAAVVGYRASLAAELERAQHALDAAGVAFEPRVEPLPLPPPQESVMALAIREAVTNVVRHAGARRCRVLLERAPGSVRLEIADDGKGGLAPEGTGLTSMRERIAALGGTLERSGSTGTRLTISLPLPAGAA